MKNEFFQKLLTIILLVLFYLLFVYLLPFDNTLEHLCLFKNVTGMPCPGCGLTRSYIALLLGNIKLAFFYHPLFLTIPIIGILTLLQSLSPHRTLQKTTNILLKFFLILFVVTYVYRMVRFFPDTSPMNYSQENVIYFLYQLFR